LMFNIFFRTINSERKCFSMQQTKVKITIAITFEVRSRRAKEKENILTQKKQTNFMPSLECKRHVSILWSENTKLTGNDTIPLST
jgi:hypothetical protein